MYVKSVRENISTLLNVWYLSISLSPRLWVRVGPQHSVIKSRGAGEAWKRPGSCGSLSSGWTERLPAVPPTGLQCRLPHGIAAKPRSLSGGWLRLPGSPHGDHHQRYTRQSEGTFSHKTLRLDWIRIIIDYHFDIFFFFCANPIWGDSFLDVGSRFHLSCPWQDFVWQQ